MAGYLVDVLEALTAAVAAAWPETAAQGIYHVTQAARITLDLKTENGELPFAAFELPLAEGDWGGGNQAYEGPCVLYRVTDDSESLDTMVGKLETLRDYLTTTGLVSGGAVVAQVLGDPVPLWGPELELNRYFLSTQRPYTCGACAFTLITGQRYQ